MSEEAAFIVEGRMNKETAWVIEGDGCYWSGCGLKADSFTRVLNDALRFAREQDAKGLKEKLFPDFAFALRVVQYTWTKEPA